MSSTTINSTSEDKPKARWVRQLPAGDPSPVALPGVVAGFMQLAIILVVAYAVVVGSAPIKAGVVPIHDIARSLGALASESDWVLPALFAGVAGLYGLVLAGSADSDPDSYLRRTRSTFVIGAQVVAALGVCWLLGVAAGAFELHRNIVTLAGPAVVTAVTSAAAIGLYGFDSDRAQVRAILIERSLRRQQKAAGIADITLPAPPSSATDSPAATSAAPTAGWRHRYRAHVSAVAIVVVSGFLVAIPATLVDHGTLFVAAFFSHWLAFSLVSAALSTGAFVAVDVALVHRARAIWSRLHLVGAIAIGLVIPALVAIAVLTTTPLQARPWGTILAEVCFLVPVPVWAAMKGNRRSRKARARAASTSLYESGLKSLTSVYVDNPDVARPIDSVLPQGPAQTPDERTSWFNKLFKSS